MGEYDRWDESTGDREQEWEDKQIEQGVRAAQDVVKDPEKRADSRLPFQADSMEGPELEQDITGWTGRSYSNMDELREGEKAYEMEM
jgi:hypothetical protein